MSEERRLKHLELIQGIITRLSTNAFLLKGWSVVLVSALFALSAADRRMELAAIAFLPALVFWGLDGFFLWRERHYRELYDRVRNQEESKLDLCMKIEEFEKTAPSYLCTVCSKTILPFHFSIIISVLLAVLLAVFLGGEITKG